MVDGQVLAGLKIEKWGNFLKNQPDKRGLKAGSLGIRGFNPRRLWLKEA